MKILYIITKSNWGGAQRHVYDLAVSMKARGHEVKVALGGEGLLKKNLESAGIFTYSIASMNRDISVSGDAGSLREIFSIIRAQKPDVLHLHSPKAAGLGALSGRLLRVKNIVMTVHGWTWNENRPIHQRLAIIFFSWLTSMLCHKTIVISRHDYDQAIRLPALRERLALIPLGIKPATLMSIDGARQSVAGMIGMSLADFNQKTTIGTIAELHKNKGLNYLVQAMSQVVERYPDTLVVIMSDGEEKERLSAQIKDKKLEKHVFLTGYVVEAAQYLKAFSFFVLPSIKEGLPYTLLEAGAANLPVISTTVGGIPDIIRDMESGILVQPRNARELAHAISFMLEHTDERKKYGTKLKEKVLRDFSLDGMVNAIEKSYIIPVEVTTPSAAPTPSSATETHS